MSLFLWRHLAAASPRLEHRPASQVITVRVGGADDGLMLRGRLVFRGTPELPGYFGLQDDREVLHLLKSDMVEILPATAIPTPTIRPINHLLDAPADFVRVQRDAGGAQAALRQLGYGDLIDREVVTFSKYRRTTESLSWAAAGSLTMVYFVSLDSAFGGAHSLYLGRVGPRVIMDHFSNLVGSAALVSQGFVFRPRGERLNRVWRISLATVATAANFVGENPLGLEALRVYAHYNVQDPIDFLVGATTAWLVAMTPEILRTMDRFGARVRRARRRCESLL